MRNTHIVSQGMHGVLEVLGPRLEFLTSPDEPGAIYCGMIGAIPPDAVVPRHSHADVESFYLLSGAVQVLSEQAGKFEWLDVKPGQFVHVPGNAKHAFRNTSSEPAVQLITTAPILGRFFREIGKPVTAASPPAPTPEDIQQFARVAAEYGYGLGSPKENKAAGIRF